MTIQEQARELAARAEREGLNYNIEIKKPRQSVEEPWYGGQVFTANRQVFPIKPSEVSQA